MSYQDIGKNIAKLRKEKNITQEELGKVVGLSGQAVSKWESGGSPDIEMLAPIADYFSVSIDSLFDRKIKDYSDLNSAIAGSFMEMSDDAERFKKAFDYCSTFQSCNQGELKICYNGNPDNSLNLCFIYSRNGITHTSNSDKLKYFFMIPEISEGIRDMFKFKEEYIKLFGVLSDSDVLKSIFYLLSIKTSAFTTKLFEKKFKFSPEKSQNIIDKLKSVGMIESVNTEFDGEIKQGNKFIYSNSFIPFILFSSDLAEAVKKYSTDGSTSGISENPFITAINKNV
ncbi:MAG: helix-turn-helix domain-containing protein [Oscillospiraceae bacterium]|nr:helix-turn-helix domain-containing protein [Oscillospiraceae bacterium]